MKNFSLSRNLRTAPCHGRRDEHHRTSFGRLVWLVQVSLALIIIAGCGQRSQTTQQAAKHYQLTGEITQLDSKLQTATINAKAIEGWMEAMTMEYPIASKQDFAKLHVGDRITATVNVRGADYDLSNIQKQNSSK